MNKMKFVFSFFPITNKIKFGLINNKQTCKVAELIQTYNSKPPELDINA